MGLCSRCAAIQRIWVGRCDLQRHVSALRLATLRRDSCRRCHWSSFRDPYHQEGTLKLRPNPLPLCRFAPIRWPLILPLRVLPLRIARPTSASSRREEAKTPCRPLCSPFPLRHGICRRAFGIHFPLKLPGNDQLPPHCGHLDFNNTGAGRFADWWLPSRRGTGAAPGTSRGRPAQY